MDTVVYILPLNSDGQIEDLGFSESQLETLQFSMSKQIEELEALDFSEDAQTLFISSISRNCPLV
jgi:hypothetical protein